MEKRSFLPLLLLIKLLISTMAAVAQIIPIRVGTVLDTDDYGEMTLNCISMALSDFYSTHQHYTTRLFLTHRRSDEGVVAAAAAALDLVKNVEVQAIIGPSFSMQANFVISLGDKAQVPIITFSATSPSLTSIRSPYFVRATLDDSSQVDAIGAIVKEFGWREVVPVYEDNEFGEGIIPYLVDALEKLNVHIPYRSVISPLATDDQIEAELYKLMTMQTRVFIVHMMSPLASRLFTKAKQIGMMSQEYAWIVTNGIMNELNSLDPSVVESMLGVIGVRPYVPKTRELESFVVRYKIQNRHAADLDIFGFWAYDSAIALAIASERASLRDLKYHNTNASMNSTDLGIFGVSAAGPKLIKALSSTTFIGLAGNFELLDGQLQAPPLEMVNFVGHGIRSIGYWTKENGIVKELNSTSKSKLASIIWPGNRTSPPKGWVIPTNGRKLRVGVPIKAGFTEFVRVTWNPNNSTTVEGYCIDVFDAVMAALPYGVPYEYIPFANPDHSMAGNYDDMTYQVYLGNYDVVAGDVTIVANRSQYVDFTLPYTESGVAMVVPIQDDNSENALVFLKPLTWQLWVTSFCSFIFIALLIWILEHGRNEEFGGSFWYQIGTILWFTFSTMVFAHKERVVSNLSRFVLITWFLVVLILTQSYTASLASMLTVQKLQPKVTDVNQLIRNKEYVGFMQGSFVLGLLKKMEFEESRLMEYDSPQKLDELLSKGSGNGGIAAAFHEVPYIKLFLGKYCSKYTMIGPINKADGLGIVFPIGSPLVIDVSRAILNVTESHKMMEIERKWLGDMSKCSGSDKLAPPKNLGLASFWVLFVIVLAVGVVVLVIHMVRFLCWDRTGVEQRPDPNSEMLNMITSIHEIVTKLQETKDTGEKGKKVSLLLDSSKAIVAYGTIASPSKVIKAISGDSFPKDCICVSIDEVVDPNALLPYPIPNNCENVGDALGSHVAWPTHLVLVKEMEVNKRIVKNYDSLPSPLKKLYLRGESSFKNGRDIFISLDDDVFGDGFQFSIDLKDIIQFCELEPISGNCIVAYIWHLYEMMKANNMVGGFQFVNPFGVSHLSTTTWDKRVLALFQGLEGVSPNQLAIVPCNVGFHWILTVIDPHKGIVYSFDPLGHQIHDGNWKQIVNEAITMFNANLGRQDKEPRWEIIKGPIQPDSKQCGFFVMRYMKEIIHKLATSGSIHLNSYFGNRSYSQKEIDEIRIEWANCVLRYIKDC